MSLLNKILNFKSRPSRLVVLGNGFDLDLGLSTSYKAFWEDRKEKLISFRYLLNEDRLIPQLEIYQIKCLGNNWYDLEEILRTYASTTYKRDESAMEAICRAGGYREENFDANVSYFNLLKKEIIDYIGSQQENAIIDTTSKAADLLKWMQKKHNITCYNFNYTDINKLANTHGRGRIDVKYIHGNLADGNIVLGASKDYLVEGYDFLLKTKQGALEMTFIEDLLKADEVIIFGLAFGRNDIHYFTDFFRQIQTDVIKPQITIYTYNEIEKQNIRNRLAEYGIDLTTIIAKTKLTFKTTQQR